jgi:transcriptional regulator GlxA family with amidase domain
MASAAAKPPHRVAVLALDAVFPLDLGIPAQIFGESSDTPYRLTLCAPAAGPVRTTSGFTLRADTGLAAVRRADTVIVPGYSPHLRIPPPRVLEALASAHARGRRVVSICTGAFALAAAGILDGRTATTHWQHAGELAARHPGVRVDRDVLYVDEGNVLTSAGVAAGIDLCLHIVRRDLGVTLANQVARGLVAAPYREGGQAQYIEHNLPPATNTSLAATRAWALARLDHSLTVAELAAHAKTSQRSFARRFVAETGTTPLHWLLVARVARARELLERHDLSVDQVADRCGLGSGANLRQHFRRIVGTSPTAYRKTFGTR